MQPFSQTGNLLLLFSLDYRLYSLGWNNCLHLTPHPVVHVLLSLNPLYRQGFSAAAYRKALELVEAEQ